MVNLEISDLMDWISDNPLFGFFFLYIIVMAGGSAFGSALLLFNGEFQVASFVANIAAAFATILLVGITASYAISTQGIVRENRIERLRPHIIELITEGIEEMLQYLEDDKSKIEEVNIAGEPVGFCYLSPFVLITIF